MDISKMLQQANKMKQELDKKEKPSYFSDYLFIKNTSKFINNF